MDSVASVIAWLEERVQQNKYAQNQCRLDRGMTSHTYSRLTHYWHESLAILEAIRGEESGATVDGGRCDNAPGAGSGA